jgi:N-methylhydantoinase A
VFAASGLLMTDLRHTAQAAWQRPLAKVGEDELRGRLASLQEELVQELERDGVAPADRYFRFAADMRCVGQFHQLTVPLPMPNGAAWLDSQKLAVDFHAAHDKAYGHADARVPVEFVNLRAEGFGRVPKPPRAPDSAATEGTPVQAGKRRIYFDRASGWIDSPVYRRDDLRRGHRLPGPCVVAQRDSTILVLPDQQAVVDRAGIIRIQGVKT